MASGFVVIFELLVVNNWYVIAGGFEAVNSVVVVRIFFAVVYVLGVLVCVNIVVAFCLDAFYKTQTQMKEMRASSLELGARDEGGEQEFVAILPRHGSTMGREFTEHMAEHMAGSEGHDSGHKYVSQSGKLLMNARPVAPPGAKKSVTLPGKMRAMQDSMKRTRKGIQESLKRKNGGGGSGPIEGTGSQPLELTNCGILGKPTEVAADI